MGLLESLFGTKPKTLREELTRPSRPKTPKDQRVRGEFYEDKFFEDQAVKDEIKAEMGDGYFDGDLIGIILNVGQEGVERILAECEEAVVHYENGGFGIDPFDKKYTPQQKMIFFQECVYLCKEQLKEIKDSKNHE